MSNTTKEKIAVSIPMLLENDNNYKLILHNDNTTPQPYVFIVLYTIFEKSPHDCLSLLLQAEMEGSAIIGTVGYEEGKEKLDELKGANAAAGLNLQVTMTQI